MKDPFKESFDLLFQCINICVEVEVALLIGKDYLLINAFDRVNELIRAHPDKEILPLLSSMPILKLLINKSQEVAVLEKLKSEEENRKLEKRWPTPSELKSAVESEDGYEFEGYRFWEDSESYYNDMESIEDESGKPLKRRWSVSNSYGIDDIEFVSTLNDFRLFIDYVASGESSPWDAEPPGCYEPPWSEQFFKAQDDCESYAIDLMMEHTKELHI